MRYLVTGSEMKAVDVRSIHEYGIPSLVLMERAALEVANKAETLARSMQNSFHRCTIWSVCGLGNNGADGVAAARILHLRGYSTAVILPAVDGRMSEEMEIQLGKKIDHERIAELHVENLNRRLAVKAKLCAGHGHNDGKPLFVAFMSVDRRLIVHFKRIFRFCAVLVLNIALNFLPGHGYSR